MGILNPDQQDLCGPGNHMCSYQRVWSIEIDLLPSRQSTIVDGVSVDQEITRAHIGGFGILRSMLCH
jgi:hypothetical protein